MPRQLASNNKWQLISIKPDELKCGDLIFLKNRQQRKLLSHIAAALGNGKIVHCAPKKNIIIESLEQCLTLYTQQLTGIEALKYIDPRDCELRKKYRGKFIK